MHLGWKQKLLSSFLFLLTSASGSVSYAIEWVDATTTINGGLEWITVPVYKCLPPRRSDYRHNRIKVVLTNGVPVNLKNIQLEYIYGGLHSSGETIRFGTDNFWLSPRFPETYWEFLRRDPMRPLASFCIERIRIHTMNGVSRGPSRLRVIFD